MKTMKQSVFFIVLVCICLFSACTVKEESNSNQELKVEKANSNYEIKEEGVDLLTDKQAALTKLYNLKMFTQNLEYEHDDREKATMDFVELLEETLLTYDLSEEDLLELYLSIFTCEEETEHDTSIRFFVFTGLP